MELKGGMVFCDAIETATRIKSSNCDRYSSVWKLKVENGVRSRGYKAFEEFS